VAAILVASLLWLADYAGGAPLVGLFVAMPMLTKLTTMVIVLAGALLVVLGLIQRLSGDTGLGDFLRIAVYLIAALAVVATLPHFLNIWRAVEITHTTNPRVVAPSVCEGLIPLSLGFVFAAVTDLLRRATKPG
jgi:hypothetical protein